MIVYHRSHFGLCRKYYSEKCLAVIVTLCRIGHRKNVVALHKGGIIAQREAGHDVDIRAKTVVPHKCAVKLRAFVEADTAMLHHGAVAFHGSRSEIELHGVAQRAVVKHLCLVVAPRVGQRVAFKQRHSYSGSERRSHGVAVHTQPVVDMVRERLNEIFGKHGVFYDMLGEEVTGLDGFYGEDIPEYEHMGVRVPSDPAKVCDEVYEKTGIVMMIVDANDLNVELLGKGEQLKDWSREDLLALIADNPAGQDRQLTPFVLIREVKE